MHADIGEKLLAGILQRGPEEIDHIVDNEETVVIMLTIVYCYGRILLIMTLDVKL